MFERGVLAYCRKERLFETGGRVLVAVSGGADSLCLLGCLQAIRPALGIEITVAHVHHGLRAQDADRDESFVAAFAGTLGLPFSAEHIDVPAGRRPGESTEAAARRLRYGALRRLAARAGAGSIAVGHTLDDRAETVLINLIRGSGIDGLSAMRPREGDVVRPLLAMSRRQVEDYDVARGYTPQLDVTNLDPVYRRNAVRGSLLPLLAQYNPRIRETLARSAQTLALDSDYLEQEARRALAAARLPSEEGVLSLDRRAVAALHPGLRAHVLRCAVEEIAGSLEAVRMEHVTALEVLTARFERLECRSLPRGIVAVADGGLLTLTHAAAAGGDAPAHSPLSTELPVPGEARFGRWTIRAEQLADESSAVLSGGGADAVSVVVDARCLQPPLTVRSRLPGDRIRPKGMQGRRRLQDILVDAKVSRSGRDFVPVVADQCGIIWVVGYAQDARTLVQGSAAPTVRLIARPGRP